MMWGKLSCDMLVIVTSSLCDDTDILNQLIQFYSNNATDLHHVTSHKRRVAPQHRDRNVTTDYCDVTSPYV